MAAETKKVGEGLADANKRSDDHEDRSRRDNLVFFNLPEETGFESEHDCQAKVQEVLNNIMSKVTGNRRWALDRVHRIGIKDLEKKVRPMIARFTYHTDKNLILLESRDAEKRKFRGREIGVSEDYSKATLNIRRRLVNFMKDAKLKTKDLDDPITGGHVKYKTLTLIYVVNDKKVYRPFSK